MKGNKEKETGTMCRKRVKAAGEIGKRKRVLFMMAVMMIALSFSACGSKKKETGAVVNDETKITSESEQQNSENETGEVSDDVFADIFDDIELNGKKVTFPFSLNELGDEYTIDDEPFAVNEDDNMISYHLYYNGEEIAYVHYIERNVSNIDRDSKMIEYSSLHSKGEISIRGIGINNSSELIKKEIPQLEEVEGWEKNGNVYGGFTLGNEKNYIVIDIENNIITGITMRSER